MGRRVPLLCVIVCHCLVFGQQDGARSSSCNRRRFNWLSSDDGTLSDKSTFATIPYIFFVHLRKTGGSTVEYTLLREAKQSIRLRFLKRFGKEHPEPGKFHNFRWFQSNGFGKIGHYDFKDLHHTRRVDKGRPYAYISILRNPVHRIVSSYWFWHRFWRYKPLMVNDDGTSKMTLQEFVESGHSKNNHQFHALRGPKDRTVADVLKTIRERYLVVGVLEQFDQFMFLVSEMLGVDSHYETRNVGNYTSRPQVTEEELQLISEANKLDMELWEGVKDIANEHFACFESSQFEKWQEAQKPL